MSDHASYLLGDVLSPRRLMSEIARVRCLTGSG